ncbi:MAG: UDP-N-acetylglucosamine 2-epimerase [Acidobacteriota bacterium]
MTSSRSDWCHLAWPLRDMRAHPALCPRLIVCGSHLAPEFGHTVDVIEEDGFVVDARVDYPLDTDTEATMARSVGHATLAFADLLESRPPDLLLASADRHEMLAPAIAAVTLRIPIAHLEGGEWTAGAIDNVVRHALTMMAHVHFTPTERATRRVVAMGEEAWRVHRVGAPSLDHLHRGKLLDPAQLADRLRMPLDPAPLVAAVHPVTLFDDPAGAEGAALLAALGRRTEPIVFCLPNADARGRALAGKVRTFCDGRANARLFENLDPLTYWSLLRHAVALVGNSSSGLMETPAVRLPAVNVGRRQEGRERAANVVDAPADPDAIGAALDRITRPAFVQSLHGLHNPYGDGHAGERLAEILAALPSRRELLLKQDTLGTI